MKLLLPCIILLLLQLCVPVATRRSNRKLKSSSCEFRGLSRDNTKYKERVKGQGWVVRSCPKGTVFKLALCRCDFRLSKVAKESQVAKVTQAPENREDLCATVDCGPTMQCFNTETSYVCREICTEGFIQASNYCRDIDECAETPNLCNEEKNETCVNTYGSYECRCKAGFLLDPVSSECEDVDECERNPCLEGLCENTVGSFLCVCEEGFTLDAQGRCISSTVAPGPLCPLREHSEDPESYKEKILGFGWISRACPSGTRFNMHACRCVVDGGEALPMQHGNQPSQPLESSGQGGQSDDELTTASLLEAARSACVGVGNTTVANPADRTCQSYIDCYNGVAHPERCQSGLLFNPVARYCDYPQNVIC